MPQPPLSFRRFSEAGEARELAALLRAGGLPATVAENSVVFDVTFTAGAERDYHVLLPGDRFEQAEKLLEEQQREDLAPLPEDHYLHGFTDEELLDVLRRGHEWSAFDRLHTERLLGRRGLRPVPAAVEAARRQHIVELAQPEKAATGWLAAGVIMAWLGGIGGMIIGWSLMSARKTLPDGRSVFRYTGRDRRRGRTIFQIGVVVLTGTLVWFLYTLR